jgi:hypothetical protein
LVFCTVEEGLGRSGCEVGVGTEEIELGAWTVRLAFCGEEKEQANMQPAVARTPPGDFFDTRKKSPAARQQKSRSAGFWA